MSELYDKAVANGQYPKKTLEATMAANHLDVADLMAENARLRSALQAIVDQVNDYERINNLAPNPGRTECWDTVARAKEVLADVGGQSK